MAEGQMFRPNDGTNLIVNYLPQTVDEAELSTMFTKCGTIEEVRVIRDGRSNISRGFGFVKFTEQEAAQAAIQMYTGHKIGRKTLRVSLSRPAGEETRDTNLMVENIPEDWDDAMLHEKFSVYGNIITHRVIFNMGGKSKELAYVRYNLKAEAEDAILALNGVNVGGRNDLVIRFADKPVVRATPELMKKNPRSAGHPYPSPARVPRETTPTGYRQASEDPYVKQDPYAAQYHDPYTQGPLHSRPPPRGTAPLRGGMRKLAPISREGPYGPRPVHGPPRQTPKVEPAWESTAPAQELDLTQYPPQHRSSYDQEKGWVVFVYNLPSTASSETLYQMFSRFGAINSVKPVVDKEEQCKGFGFVHMLNYEDAVRSIQAMDGQQYAGKDLQVRFKNEKK